MRDYIEQAHVTASDKFYGEAVPYEHFEEILSDCISALKRLDVVKKALFYGKFPNRTLGRFRDLSGLPSIIAEYSGDLLSDLEKSTNIIHAILGKATEAGELLEALESTILVGLPFDFANALEEVGDGLWYDALLLKAIGSNFEEAQRVNIAKLRQRFGEKFSEFDANNRDLFEERKILENKG